MFRVQTRCNRLTDKHDPSHSTAPKTLAELRPQYEALCRVLGLDPTLPTTLATLRDPSRIPPAKLLHPIETEGIGEHGTFRGCLDGTWLPASPDPMTWQRTGDLARALHAKGVMSIAIGDLTEEWYLYAISHAVQGPRDVLPNLLRYFPRAIVERLVDKYVAPPDDAGAEVAARWMGEMLSDGQVHVPVRLFTRDFYSAGFPVVRYEIRWTPEQVRPKGEGEEAYAFYLGGQSVCFVGYVTHGTDRCFWALRLPNLTDAQQKVAIAWLDAVDKEVEILEREGKPTRPVHEALTLREDQTIAWQVDARWDRLMDIVSTLPGEGA